jgi:hypothetical protein
MNTAALITMLCTHAIVTGCTIYFFRKVLKKGPSNTLDQDSEHSS